uniref:LIM zinc-binding domain-containing protein n=1 Tax=Arcella intermedia TaxID=1963864 RepID=A0A6B2L443_9EUKA
MVQPQAQPVKAQAQHNPTPDLDDLMAELMPSNKPPLQTQQSRNQMPQRNEVEVDPLESLMDQLSGPSHNPPAYNNSNPNMQPNNSYNNNYNKPTPTTYNDPRPINNNFNKPTPTNYNDQRPSSAPRGPNVPSTNDLEDMLNSLAVDNNYSNNPPKNNFNNNQKPNQYNNNFSNDPRATLYGAQPVDFTNPPQSINNRNTMMDPRMSGAFDPRAGYGGFSNDPRATVSLGNFGAFPNDPRASMGPGYDPRAMGGPGYDPRASMGPGYDPRMMGGPNPRATAQDLNVIMEGLNNPAMSSNMGGSMQRRPEQKLPKGVCAGCRKYITGPQRVQALGKDYHPEHFQCSTCGRPIGNGSFYENEGQPQCEMCYQSVFCQKCGKCNRPITSTCTTAIGQSWHPECFTCTRCNVPFGNSTFFVHFSRPYCSVCIAGVR